MPDTEKNHSLVSVIIPAYNHEKYVKAAIDSVIAQSYPHIELVVLDDGSPDNTWSVIQSMEGACRERFARIVFRRQENQGICPTLNNLLDLAQGDYIMRLDSDDLVKPHSISRLLAFLSQNPEYGLAVGDNEIIDENGQVVFWTRKRRNTIKPEEARFKTFGHFLSDTRWEIDFSSDSFGDYYNFVAGNYMPNGYLVRREIMDQIRYTPLAPQEDHYLMLQISKLAKMKYFNEILHSYRWHTSNNIKQREKMWNYSRNTMRHELNILKQAGDEERHQRASEILNKKTVKTKFKLGYFLEIYKYSTYFEKNKYMLRIGGKTFTLKELKFR